MWEPSSEEEAARFLGEAAEAGLRVRVEGKGTRLGLLPPEGEAGEAPERRVTARALGGIQAYEPADLVMTVGAGTPLAEVREAAASEGQWVALDPPGHEGRSVGGAVAGGEHGPLHAGLGLPREQVLAARVATGGGRLLSLGAPVVKNVAGFDLLKLLPGSRGRLGLVTSVTLRLHPRPPDERTVLFRHGDLAAAARTARRLAAASLPLMALELLARCPEAGGAEGAVAVRLSGRDGTLDALQGSLEEAADEPAAEVLDRQGSRRFFQELARAEGEGGRPVTLSFRPARLPEVMERLRTAIPKSNGAEGGSVPAARVHVLGGHLRLTAGGGGEREVAGALERALRGFRGEDRSGDGSGAPRAQRGGDEPVKRLVEGVRRVFDPAGVLVDPGAVGREVTL